MVAGDGESWEDEEYGEEQENEECAACWAVVHVDLDVSGDCLAGVFSEPVSFPEGSDGDDDEAEDECGGEYEVSHDIEVWVHAFAGEGEHLESDGEEE